MTNAEKNQLAALVGVAVVLLLCLIAPASREWITGHSVAVVDYAWGSLLAPMFDMATGSITGAWGWLTGLVS
jgi:hypothetical protein